MLIDDLDIHRHSDWTVFARRLEDSVNCGRARRIKNLRQIYAPSEEWYVDTVSGEIYVYLSPDDRVLPEWRRVDIFEPTPMREWDYKSINGNGLSAIPTGLIDKARTQALSQVLHLMVRKKLIEIVDVRKPQSRGSIQAWVSTYRDSMTNVLYEFVEQPEGNYSSWTVIYRE